MTFRQSVHKCKHNTYLYLNLRKNNKGVLHLKGESLQCKVSLYEETADTIHTIILNSAIIHYQPSNIRHQTYTCTVLQKMKVAN